MPARPQPAAMTADQFRSLLETAGLTGIDAAARLGVSKSAVHRWLNGDTPISAERAALIRERIKPAGE